jgi:hypothetical protein
VAYREERRAEPRDAGHSVFLASSTVAAWQINRSAASAVSMRIWGATRISASISVGCVEMEFPNDSESVAGQQVESNPFVEGAIELLHEMPPQFDCRVCRNKRSAASAIWLKSSAPRKCPSPRAAIASKRSRETTSDPSRSNRSRANPSQNESSSLLDTDRAPPRSGPLPNHAGRGPEERMPANRGVLARHI